MNCPRCGFDVADGRPDCPRCGVVFAKLRRPSQVRPAPVEVSRPGAVPSVAPPALERRDAVRLSARERVVVMESLARGVGAGLPLLDLLRALGEGGGRAGQAARALAAEIAAGATLARAWQRAVHRPGVAACVLLEAAETTGEIDRACVAVGRLAAQVDDVLRELRYALLRPALMVMAACVILPVPTLVLRSGLAYALEAGLSLGLVAVLVAAVVLGGRFVLAAPARIERLLELPIGRDVDRWVLTTVLEGALRSGAPPAAVLQRLAEGASTPARRARFEAARGVLQGGGTFSEAAALLGVYDASARLEIRAGEESGTLDEVFHGLAQAAQAHLARRTAAALRVVTFLVGLVALGLIALRVLAAFQGVFGGQQRLLDEIEAEMPVRALDSLNPR